VYQKGPNLAEREGAGPENLWGSTMRPVLASPGKPAASTVVSHTRWHDVSKDALFRGRGRNIPFFINSGALLYAIEGTVNRASRRELSNIVAGSHRDHRGRGFSYWGPRNTGKEDAFFVRRDISIRPGSREADRKCFWGRLNCRQTRQVKLLASGSGKSSTATKVIKELKGAVRSRGERGEEGGKALGTSRGRRG